MCTPMPFWAWSTTLLQQAAVGLSVCPVLSCPTQQSSQARPTRSIPRHGGRGHHAGAGRLLGLRCEPTTTGHLGVEPVPLGAGVGTKMGTLVGPTGSGRDDRHAPGRDVGQAEVAGRAGRQEVHRAAVRAFPRGVAPAGPGDTQLRCGAKRWASTVDSGWCKKTATPRRESGDQVCWLERPTPFNWHPTSELQPAAASAPQVTKSAASCAIPTTK